MMMYSYSDMIRAEDRTLRALAIYFVLHGKLRGMKPAMYHDTRRRVGDAGPGARTTRPSFADSAEIFIHATSLLYFLPRKPHIFCV